MQLDSLDAAIKYFSRATREDWKKGAAKEIDGNDPFASLSWRAEDNIVGLPYYDAGHVFNEQWSAVLRAADQRSWLNLPFAADSAAFAEEHLRSGADGVVFDWRQKEKEDSLNLKTDDNKASLLGFYVKPGFAKPRPEAVAELSRATVLFWDSIPNDDDISESSNIQHGIRVGSSTPAREVGEALAMGVAMFERLSLNYPGQDTFSRICFSLPANQKIAETVAKFRALRMLWLQVARAYGLERHKAEDIHLHARSEFVEDGHYGPQENMLKGTFSAVGAVLGGCNSLTVETAAEPAFARRWGRNLYHILKEESFLDRVNDPAGGSFAIEALTEEISRRAWEIFVKQVEEV